MHYQSDAFSIKPGNSQYDTMRAKNGARIPRNLLLTSTDISAINSLYKCPTGK
jgi:hypothetical protein